MRNERFTFLCTKDERLSLERLAAFHQRTKGDTIRLLIQQAILDLPKDALPGNVQTHTDSQKIAGKKT